MMNRVPTLSLFRRLFSATTPSVAGADKRVLVVGGCGAMGEAILDVFGKKHWETFSLDIKTSSAASKSYTFSASDAKEDYGGTIESLVHTLEMDGVSFTAVVCAAGGWAGGNISSNHFLQSLETLWQQNVQSAATSTHLAAKFLARGGMLTLTGAEVVRQGGTSFMPAYGMSKAATHHLVASASQGYLPDECTVNAILPVTINTPANRDAMPDADFSSWIEPNEIAVEIESWVDGPRPRNGALELLGSGGEIINDWKLRTFSIHDLLQSIEQQNRIRNQDALSSSQPLFTSN